MNSETKESIPLLPSFILLYVWNSALLILWLAKIKSCSQDSGPGYKASCAGEVLEIVMGEKGPLDASGSIYCLWWQVNNVAVCPTAVQRKLYSWGVNSWFVSKSNEKYLYFLITDLFEGEFLWPMELRSLKGSKKDQQTNNLSDFACITDDQFHIHKKNIGEL